MLWLVRPWLSGSLLYGPGNLGGIPGLLERLEERSALEQISRMKISCVLRHHLLPRDRLSSSSPPLLCRQWREDPSLS